MDIAGLSIQMTQSRFANAVQISLMKLAMNTTENNGAALQELLQAGGTQLQSVAQPGLGEQIDIAV